MTFEICECCTQKPVSFERGKPDVALIAEDAPDAASRVAVINDKSTFRYLFTAYFTPERLLFEQRKDICVSNSVPTFVMRFSTQIEVTLRISFFP